MTHAPPLSSKLASALPGRFLVFDGPDGSGKTSRLEAFVASCQASGLDVTRTREPGGTEFGERIRSLLLDHSDEPMAVRCEMLLYMASRAQLIERVIAPALERRSVVVADRFISSTLAYQGTAGGLPASEIHAVGEVVCAGARPDVTVIFDVDQQTAAARMGLLLDRMESKGAAFHARVRAGYLDQAARDPDHYLVIDATGTEPEVHAGLLASLETVAVERWGGGV